MFLSSKTELLRRVARTGPLGAAVVLLGIACAPDDDRTVVVTPELSQEPRNASSLRELASQHTAALKSVEVAEAGNLDRFLKDRDAAVRLGKALFWDQQVGSDGQACASCHFHAGADNRTKNQLNPGFRNTTASTDSSAFNDDTGFGPPNQRGFGANYDLSAADFPLRKLSDPSDRDSSVLSDTNDVVSSQGAFNATFAWLGVPNDEGVPSLLGNGVPFSIDGALTRNVEPRQTPTVINAVFNHRNFWDGRARAEFNGASPIGNLDSGPRVVEKTGWGPALVGVNIRRSSLASQATGPGTSDLEMSFAGRRFPEIARKLVHSDVVPLGAQYVDRTDSVLGCVSAAPAPGIRGRYAAMIKEAFRDRWWNIPGFIVDVSGSRPVLKWQAAPSGPNQFTVMEYNFSLFFGLAVQEYEKTLVSDDSPFDRFMSGNDHALTAREKEGFGIFLEKGKCINCHSGAELTNASAQNAGGGEIIERMIMGDKRVAVYDNGFYNIGVRPTAEDLGVGATIGPRASPLSNSRLHQRDLKELVPLLQRFFPYLSQDRALRFANRLAGVPRIPARPIEAEELLKEAAPPAADELKIARDAVAEAIGALPPWGGKGGLAHRLGKIDTLLAEAAAAMAAGTANVAAPKLVDASEQLDRLGGTLYLSVKAQTEKARDLLAPGVSLLPDPIDPGPDPEHPFGPPLRPEERVAVDGAFKVPTLRNVSETAPYFHNGGQATLEQVVEFYNRGGDFARTNKDNLDPDIQPLGLSTSEQAALVAFLHALTDDRVRKERAPFDHPSISVPNGGTTPGLGPIFPTQPVFEDRFEVGAVGSNGGKMKLGTPGTPLGHFLQPLH